MCSLILLRILLTARGRGGDDDDAGGLARVVAADEVLCAPREASVLFPRSGGNMHAFTAVTPCAILDVLTPPYSEELGRPSTYFTDISIPSLPGARVLTTDIVTRLNTYCSMVSSRNLNAPLQSKHCLTTRCKCFSSSSGFAVLEETDLPEDFRVAGAPYLGPELTVDLDYDDDDYDD
jgi:plant cysteine oxidase